MDILKHPLFLLAVSAIVSGIFIPWFLRRRQYKQKELELKIQIVSDITESVVKFITIIYLFQIRKNETQNSIDEESQEKKMKEAFKEWEVLSCVICTKLDSYFPKKKKDKSLRERWDEFKEELLIFYDNYEANKRKVDEKKLKIEKDRLFKRKHKIIEEILISKITGFRSQKVGKILNEGGEKMKKQIKAGLLLIVIGISIPIVSFFFLGSPPSIEIERKLTQNEINAIKEAEAKKLEKMREDETKARNAHRYKEVRLIRRMIETFEKERTLFGKDYYNKKWKVKTETESVIPYNYFIGTGFILFFVGIGMILLSYPAREKKSAEEPEKSTKKSEGDK